VRFAAGILLLAVLCRTVVADPERSRVHPVKRLTFGAFFVGHGGTLDGESEGGMGPVVEVAYGSGRTQYFVETGFAWVTLTDEYSNELDTGKQLRGGIGARYIARSFPMDNDGAVEMILEGAVGAHKFWWASGDELVRPEISFGFGLQTRKYEDPHVSVRFGLRVFFAPTGEHTTTTARCTGTCDTSTVSNAGILGFIGGAL